MLRYIARSYINSFKFSKLPSKNPKSVSQYLKIKKNETPQNNSSIDKESI